MKKILIAICLVAGIHTVSQAQFSLSPRVAPAFPTGTFQSLTNTGFGFGLQADYTIREDIRVGIAIDRYSFRVEPFNLNFLDVDFRLIPVTANVQYLLPMEGIRPYIGIEAGIYNYLISAFFANYRGSAFGLAPVLGVLYPYNDRLDFFVNAKYQTVFVNQNLPLSEQLNIDRNIHFIPVNVGVSVKFNQ